MTYTEAKAREVVMRILANRMAIDEQHLPRIIRQGDLVILADWHYWSLQYDNLADWLAQHCPDTRIQGVTIRFTDPAQLTHFLLRWE